MKEKSIFVEYDVSTTEAISFYNTAKKLPQIFEAMKEFRGILSERLPYDESKKDDIYVIECKAINDNKEFLLNELVRVFAQKGIMF